MGITVLGVDVLNDPAAMERNFEKVLIKAKRIMNSWLNRGLSLLGKVKVVNTLIASLYVYKLTVLPISVDQLNILEDEISKFIWNGRRAKIPLKTLQKSVKCGGLNLVDIKRRAQALMCSWTKKLQLDQNMANLVYSFFKVPLKEDLWRCNLNIKDVKEVIDEKDNLFWTQVISAWCLFNFNEHVCSENQIIWMNSYIRIDNRPIWWPILSHSNAVQSVEICYTACLEKRIVKIHRQPG